MTISVPSATKFRYEGNGVTDTFSYDARVFSSSDIVVQILTRSTSDVEETLTLSTDYTATILSDGTASVQITNSLKVPDNTQDIFLSRSVDSNQTVSLPTGTVFPAKLVEDALDKMIVKVQDTETKLNSAAVVPPQIIDTVTLPLPSAGKVIGWNAAGDNFENYTPNTDTYLTVSPYAETNIINTASEAALKAAINAEADVDFLAYSDVRGKFFGNFVGTAGGATINLGLLNSAKVNITGSGASISSFGTSVTGQPIYFIRFAGANTLVNGANLILPTGANITTASGDTMILIDEGFSVFRVYSYLRADGTALSGGADTILTANSSVKTPSATNNYLAMTGSQIDLPVGQWKLEGGVYFGNGGASPLYFDTRVRWCSANGGDSAAVPAAIESSANITLDAGVAAPTSFVATGSGSVAVAGQAALPIIVTVATATTTVYLVPYLQATTATNGRVSTHLIATKIN